MSRLKLLMLQFEYCLWNIHPKRQAEEFCREVEFMFVKLKSLGVIHSSKYLITTMCM